MNTTPQPPSPEYNCPPVCPKCQRCHRGECNKPSTEQLARILGTKFYAARHPVEFEAALAELTAIIRENEELKEINSITEKCVVCGHSWCPSLVESGHCIFCIANGYKSQVQLMTAENKMLTERCCSFREKAEAFDWLNDHRDFTTRKPDGSYYLDFLSAINSARKEQSK